PDIPAFRMRYAAAASPPNPPPTMCAFICLLPCKVLPTRAYPGCAGFVEPPTITTPSRLRSEKNSVRLIEAFIDELDVTALGNALMCYAPNSFNASVAVARLSCCGFLALSSLWNQTVPLLLVSTVTSASRPEPEPAGRVC